jgi:NtrC-family two-component system response regulator AlgB
LLESEMFGHVKGAFTGAVRDTSGKVAAAAGGTLFLDEVADLPLPLQPKLLRFLQERRYERVGETRTRTADVRLVAATNKDLDAEVAAGRFRDDLLYRLNVVEFVLPPLRSRSDLIDLANHLLSFFGRQTGRRIEGFSSSAQAVIRSYSWPGNLRELRNAIERAVLFASGPLIEVVDLPGRVRSVQPGGTAAESGSLTIGGPVTLEQLETEHIRRVLQNTETRDEAARILGIDPSTLYRKRRQLGL